MLEPLAQLAARQFALRLPFRMTVQSATCEVAGRLKEQTGGGRARI